MNILLNLNKSYCSPHRYSKQFLYYLTYHRSAGQVHILILLILYYDHILFHAANITGGGANSDIGIISLELTHI